MTPQSLLELPCSTVDVPQGFLVSVAAVLNHLRESTSLPNWVLTHDRAEGREVVASSVRAHGMVGRSDLDRRGYVSILSAPVADHANGGRFGWLTGYVTERDVANVVTLAAVAAAVQQRAACHQPLVELFATLLADSLSFHRLDDR